MHNTAASDKPAWAQAVIVAEYNEDRCDMQTDYFATTTTRQLVLAWSKHMKDDFRELRKAALNAPETTHLGPGKGRYICRVVCVDQIHSNGAYYCPGHISHWHGDPVEFTTHSDAEQYVATQGIPEAIAFGDTTIQFRWDIAYESIEHREKYSMGKGYYLKASHTYANGWVIRKTTVTDLSSAAEWRLTAQWSQARPKPRIRLALIQRPVA